MAGSPAFYERARITDKRASSGRGSMPELPEVETTMRALAARLSGRQIAALDQRRPDLRAPLPERLAERLTGAG